ncbi:MAG: type II secretion system protein [Candidatus Riflebacteria bacterium]|nr:type II secretion system protein [Candidatus Riflebacteria bacterium]
MQYFRKKPNFFQRLMSGFTLVELIIALGILSMSISLAVVCFRNARATSNQLTSAFSFHMSVREATEKLMDFLVDGTEVVKPLPGGTLSFFVYKDIVNNIRVLHLEKSPSKPNGPFNLVCQIDDFNGPTQKISLIENVKEIFFTSITPGLVIVHFTMVQSNGKELASMFEISLKNIGSIDS